MRSTPHPAGNLKMRGKREKRFACLCCSAQDFRRTERRKEDRRQIEMVRKA